MPTIPASQLVNVTPGVLPAGGSAIDLNGLILTSSTRIPIGSVLQFASVAAVLAYFGGGTKEVAMASVYFAGFDNSNVKPANLLFAQYPVAAVSAFVRGGNISTMPLTTLQALNGTLTFTIDNVLKTATVNLSAATSFSNAGILIGAALAIDGVQAAAFTGSITGTVLTVSAMTSGSLAVGQEILGAGVTAETYISSLGTGTGGAGTYNISTTQTVASEAMTANQPAVTFDSVSGGFVVASGTTGASSTITFGSGALATSLLLTQATGAVISQGAAAAVPATFMTALVANVRNWALFTTSFDPDAGSPTNPTVKLAFAAWTSGQNNRFGYVAWDTDPTPTTTLPAPTSLGGLVAANLYSGTCLVWEPSDLNHAAFLLGAAASIDFTQTNGRITFAYKSQAGLTAGVTDQTTANNLGGNPQSAADRGNGYNYYGAFGVGNPQYTWFQRGYVSGAFQWLDSFVNQIWLNSGFQAALLNLLQNSKSIPYNAAGRAMIESALADMINAGLNHGVFRAGITLSASQIANVNAAAGKQIAATLSNQGWYLLIGDTSPTVRQQRGSPPCTFFYVDGQSVQVINLASIVLQ